MFLFHSKRFDICSILNVLYSSNIQYWTNTENSDIKQHKYPVQGHATN
mgnify:CR=1 FL=1